MTPTTKASIATVITAAALVGGGFYVFSRPDYTAYVLSDHRMQLGRVSYAPPYSTVIAVHLPPSERPDDRCIAVLFFDGGNAPTGQIQFSEAQTRRDGTWLKLPIRSLGPAPGQSKRDASIEIKATPYKDHNCLAISSPNVGEVLLSRVDVNLLPRTTEEALP